ncbi:hypothetical protein OKW30_003712 [Paraburkholderia sp. Clong3]|uniref:WYL domain-containing protein n=1 Tax=Paraburkholderia sp. Clong3 TaxID=2991061 RepID=UPI003D2155F7
MQRSANLENDASSQRRHSGPWGQERRLEFIDFRLQWDGRINRSDLTEHFGISVPQASADIGGYTQLAPHNLSYDRRERVYLASPTFSPVFAPSSANNYLNNLLGRSTGILSSDASYVGWLPPIALAAAPVRAVPAPALVAVIRAMRNRYSVQVLYQSMSRPEPSWREITPHGIANDGFRWHVRAYCHARRVFRDFVFARVLEVRMGSPSDVRVEADEAWFKPVRLVLVPNAGLSQSKRRIIELDYEMVNGEALLETREAMLYYVLQRLGLSRDGAVRPEAQQIALKNADEVRAIVETLAKNYE